MTASPNNPPAGVAMWGGTSMSTPFVAGTIAYWAAKRPDLAQDPAAMKDFLYSLALKGVVTGNPVAGDRKLLLNNGQAGR